jgi:hypothetical protein
MARMRENPVCTAAEMPRQCPAIVAHAPRTPRPSLTYQTIPANPATAR